MTKSDLINARSDFKLIFRKTYSEFDDIESALSELKRNGASQMDSLKVIKSELNLSIREADEIIPNLPQVCNMRE